MADFEAYRYNQIHSSNVWMTLGCLPRSTSLEPTAMNIHSHASQGTFFAVAKVAGLTDKRGNLPLARQNMVPWNDFELTG